MAAHKAGDGAVAVDQCLLIDDTGKAIIAIRKDGASRLARPAGFEPRGRTATQTKDTVGSIAQRYELARPVGFEPTTSSLEGSCSIQLSYGRVGDRSNRN